MNVRNFTVRTGGHEWKVRAKTESMAALIALHENEPECLGLHVKVLEDGETEDKAEYLNSLILLQVLGVDLENADIVNENLN